MINCKLGALSQWLNGRGLFVVAYEISKIAAYEFDEGVASRIKDSASRRSGSPFGGWFPEGGRVYIPIGSGLGSGEVSEDIIRNVVNGDLKYLKQDMIDNGHNWSDSAIFTGRNGSNESLNVKFIKRKLLLPSLKKHYNENKSVFYGIDIGRYLNSELLVQRCR